MKNFQTPEASRENICRLENMEVHQFFCRAFPSKPDLEPGSCDQIESGPGSEPLILTLFS